MKKHIVNYLKHFNKCPDDVFLCEACGGNTMISFHHIIYKSHQGGDEVENVLCLCGSCHDMAHFKTKPHLTQDELRSIHLTFMENKSKN